jgi:DNA-directed RNA polymerase specialized sigma24 family protein
MSIDINGTQKAEESDDYLIELMGLKEDFPDEALEAYGKIYTRYWEALYKIAIKIVRDLDDAEDLVADTFNQIYKRASSFKKGKLKQKKNIRIATLSWMTRIMKNVFYDLYLDEQDKQKKFGEPLEESYIIKNVKIIKHLENAQDDLIEELETEENQTIENIELNSTELELSNVAKVEEYLNKQTERDTPTEVLDYIEHRWGTRRENIRKILEKFRKAIKSDLQPQLTIRK